MSSQIQTLIKIFIVFLALLTVTLIPFPEAAEPFRPQWLAMLVLYATLFHPKSFGVVSAWCFGLITDVATGAILGQHAMGFLITAYIARGISQQYQLLSFLQQLLTAFVALTIYIALKSWILGITGIDVNLGKQWLSLITSLVLWHWLTALLNHITLD